MILLAVPQLLGIGCASIGTSRLCNAVCNKSKRPRGTASLRHWAKLLAILSLIVGLVPPARAVTAPNSVTLAWNRSPGTNIVGYKVYYGVASRTYTAVVSAGNSTNATVSGLTSGATYFFAVTSYDPSGLESDYSSEI